MDRISIVGGKALNGTLAISGAKNAALPLMIASLLTPERLTLKNVPNLADVNTLARILRNHGVDLAVDGKRADPSPYLGETFHLTARDIVDTTAPYEMVSRMRASFWVLGPLLARCGEARVSMPGGCAIGTRPVDLHLTGLKALGAEIDIDGGYVVAKARKGLKGARVVFPKVSVGATHAVLMTAALAKGETVIENAAREPEIGDVAECLVKMGAKIEGIGTSTLRIQGTDRLEGAVHTVLPDRIETGTYAFAVAAAGGDVELKGARKSLLETAFAALEKTGVGVIETPTGVRVSRNGGALEPITIETQPFPGFPTDLQAQLMALMTKAERHQRDPRDHLREPFHARAGAGAARRRHPAAGRHGDRQGRQEPARGPGDGHRPARLGVARHRRPDGRGQDHHQPRLPSRPRLRAPGAEALRLRRQHRAAGERVAGSGQGR